MIPLKKAWVGQASINITKDAELMKLAQQSGCKGLLIGLVLEETAGKARKYTTALKDNGILCKETHDWIIRFAPPLVITKKEIDSALEVIRIVLG